MDSKYITETNDRVREIIKDQRLEGVVIVGSVAFHIYMEFSPEEKKLLEESKSRGFKVSGQTRGHIHAPHTRHCQKHVHLLKGKNQSSFLAINMDGSRRHGGPTQLSRSIMKGLKRELPDFDFPEDGVFESASLISQLLFKLNS